MRTITLIIIHCSATPEGKSLSAEACRQDHILHRGFRDIGYHFYITRDGEIHRGRALEKIGAHCRNHNAHSVGVCYEGGLDANGKPKDTRTLEQKYQRSSQTVGIFGNHISANTNMKSEIRTISLYCS